MSRKYREWKEGVKENNRLQSPYLLVYTDHVEVHDAPPRLSRKEQTFRYYLTELKRYRREFRKMRREYQDESSQHHKKFEDYYHFARPMEKNLGQSKKKAKNRWRKHGIL